jgi:hypothetical protein
MVTVLVPFVLTFVPDSGTKPTRSIAMMYHGAPAAATHAAPPQEMLGGWDTSPPV